MDGAICDIWHRKLQHFLKQSRNLKNYYKCHTEQPIGGNIAQHRPDTKVYQDGLEKIIMHILLYWATWTMTSLKKLSINHHLKKWNRLRLSTVAHLWHGIMPRLSSKPTLPNPKKPWLSNLESCHLWFWSEASW